MKKIEDKNFKKAKKRFLISVIFLLAGLIYTISPIDIIPDILGPIGWVDDIATLFSAFAYSAYSYFKLKKSEKIKDDNAQG